MKNGSLQHLNRTGAALSPVLTAELVEGARSTKPSSRGNAEAIAHVRISYAHEAEPLGDVPPPATVKGVLKTAATALTGKSALVLVDKLGERLAFERSGTRLYDALISKFDAFGTWRGGPSREDLLEIRNEEQAHFMLLKDCMERVGGDPTAVTPAADLQAVAGKGLCAVVTDARTNLREGLEAILVAELVDNDCWETLIDLAETMDQGEMLGAFNEALVQEREHLRRVRLWLGAGLSEEATGKLAEPFVARAEERERRMSAGEPSALAAAGARQQATGKSATGKSAAGKTATRKSAAGRAGPNKTTKAGQRAAEPKGAASGRPAKAAARPAGKPTRQGSARASVGKRARRS